MMVTDTSGSMLAKDVRPDRLVAAREAARDAPRQVPEDFRLGLVKFGNTAEQVLEPTTDRTRMELALRQLDVTGATAMGDGLRLGLQAAQEPVPDGLGGTRKLPSAIVLLSDGASTRGEDPIDVATARQEGQDPDLHGRARHARGRARDQAARTARPARRRCRRTR